MFNYYYYLFTLAIENKTIEEVLIINEEILGMNRVIICKAVRKGALLAALFDRLVVEEKRYKSLRDFASRRKLEYFDIYNHIKLYEFVKEFPKVLLFFVVLYFLINLGFIC